MLFTELRYGVFFLVVFCVYWLLRGDTARKRWLLVCSYVFYAAWDARFCTLILASTTVDYVAGSMIARPRPRLGRKLWLAGSLTVNLGLLGVFKYFNFFIESSQGLLSLFGLDVQVRTLDIILPVGISFYTFQTLSYTIDIYRGRMRPIESFLDFALFVSFFPQLVAGPIVRAVDFLPQLAVRHVVSKVDFRAALTLFLIGFTKKACIADNLAVVVDGYFAAPQEFGALSAWSASILYCVQFYCDFSGYSDMAIASAALLGYQLPINFKFPFFVTNISDFWRRWHISMSYWFRDYVFFPLTKLRPTRLQIFRNLMITMVVIGLWHGADWGYVAFGVFHGTAMIGHSVWLAWSRRGTWSSNLARWIGPYVTFAYVCGTLIVFRPIELEETLAAARAFVLLESIGERSLPPVYGAIFLGLVAVHWISYKGWLSEPWRKTPPWLSAFVLGAWAALALQWAAKDYQPFLYFQF